MKNLKLALKNREVDPASWESLYSQRVSKEVRKRYDQNAVEAIISNYLSDPNDDKYKKEFEDLQNYRRYCKELVKLDMGESHE